MRFQDLGNLTFLLATLGACLGGPTRDEAASQPPGDFSDRGGIGVAAPRDTQLAAATVTLDPRRSLAVTDVALTTQFTLEGVLTQLAAQGGTPKVTAQQLFQQLWDTQNTRATGVTTGAHCDDNGQTVNGFPYSCRPAEGAMASAPSMANFSIVGLFNRFDLASPTGVDCGEYRMVFARTDGPRAFIIFEAVLSNPNSFDGVMGCLPVANYWASLSAIADPAQRAAKLRTFYFNGIENFSPVITFGNYGFGGGPRRGQVRVNQFVQAPWQLHEFMLTKPSSTTPLQFVPRSVKVNPFPPLVADGGTDPRAATFQKDFITQVGKLALNDLNRFDMAVANQLNAGESNNDASGRFTTIFQPTGPFAAAIQTELDRIGSTLTPSNIVARAQALSCAGCHQLSNKSDLGGGLVWPSSAGFVHATEFRELGPDGERFVLSPALTGVFLPHRAKILSDYLALPRCTPNTQRCDFGCALGNGTSAEDCIVQCSPDGSSWIRLDNCGWAQNGLSSSSCEEHGSTASCI